MDQCVITRQVTVAAGVFAPGHLGELTQIVPFEMVDRAVAETGAVQARVRDLPARVVVYLLLAAGLFAEVGYLQVWDKLTAGLGGLPAACPSGGALWQARARLGAAPLRWLFDLLRGPAAGTAGCVRWHGLLVCAIDGTTMSVPDSDRNLAVYRKAGGRNGSAGYPLLRLSALAGCGTRTVIDAVFTPFSTGEQDHARRLLRSLHAGMIVLLDRNYGAAALTEAIAGTGADLLVRLKANRKLPVLARYPDGSWLSRTGPVEVRVTRCQITIATSTGKRTADYTMATTLLDWRQHPAASLITLYHERWEIETAYLELKSSMLGGRVLRARTPAGIAQELYALLTCYQILRIAIADATLTAGADPDRASFTIALNAARDLVIQAAAVIAGTSIDLAGQIGARVLARLMPDRRLRITPRVVKRALSRYPAIGRVTRRSYKATLSISIIAGNSP